MNRGTLLKRAVTKFEVPSIALGFFTPIKLQDIYGYQYLVRQEQTPLKASSIHKDEKVYENDFGLKRNNRIILSTPQFLKAGDIVVCDNGEYAVAGRYAQNETDEIYHYDLESAYSYYNEFIINEEAQAERILGSNSLRYFIDANAKIPIIPSMFETDLEKYISVDVWRTEALGTPYRDPSDGRIYQPKKDYVKLIAVGLTTDELQFFIFNSLKDKTKQIGYANTPSWELYHTYDKNLDLKGNVWKLDLIINYYIITNEAVDGGGIIKQIACTIIPSSSNTPKE